MELRSNFGFGTFFLIHPVVMAGTRIRQQRLLENILKEESIIL